MSSPDPTWDGFCWRHEDGRIYAITHAIRDMHRPFWVQAQPAAQAKSVVQPAAQANPLTQLQQQRDQLQRQLQQAQTESEQLQAQNAQILAQFQQLQAQFAQLQAQLQQLHIQNIQLQAQLQQQTQTTVLSNSGASGTAVSPTLQPPPLTIPPVATPTVTPPRPAAVAAPAIQNITTSLARNPAMPLSTRPVSQIDRIIIHHTATPPTVGAERIAAFLVSNRGRPGINYHYFITADGTIQQTNELTGITLQSDPQFNPVAVGIAFAGDFTNATPAQAQIESGARLIAWLLRQLGLSPQAVYGHKELSKTQSPGVQWDDGARWGNQLRQRIQALLG
jgi:hypothetical protein